MQIIYLITQLTSRIATAARKYHSEHLSAALSREFALDDPRMRADIQRLIEQATPPAAAAAGENADTVPASSAFTPRKPGGFRAVPLPGLPTHLRYSTS